MATSQRIRAVFGLVLLILVQGCASSYQKKTEVDTSYGDKMVRQYLQDQVRQIESAWDEKVVNAQQWQKELPKRRQELYKMLGLHPMPERTPLETAVTGTLDHPEFTVEKLHFQSMPGLYVTANLYVPKNVEKPVPGVLYVCGHANRFKDGVSLGAKTAYQRHPAWYARHGYVALIIDTIQLHEIEGLHHGTYREDRWWWWNRGYTPLGVETWNSIRALDYLESRPEVDPSRLGIAGRSGGGIYSWLTLALDDRIKAAVPTAGITDLENMVVDGAVNGHCDCMFPINSQRWDLTEIAALASPTPTLLANGDHDPLFPLDGVTRVYHKARQVYAMQDKPKNWDRLIVDAPHADIPPIRQGMYRWMHRHLKDKELTVTDTAKAFFEPAQLKVFDEIPEDEINTEIDKHFVSLPETEEIPANPRAWEQLQEQWLNQLAKETFNGWPTDSGQPSAEQVHDTTFGDVQLTTYAFKPQEMVEERIWVLRKKETRPDGITVAVVDQEGWKHWIAGLRSAFSDGTIDTSIVGPGAHAVAWPQASKQVMERLKQRIDNGEALAVFAPRGVGPTTWSQETPGYGVRRSFMLLGQTRDGMQIWDVRQAVEALQAQDELSNAAVRLEGKGVMAGISLYAGIYTSGIDGLRLYNLPATHRNGPILLNVRKVFDMPQALALARGRVNDIQLYGTDRQKWKWPQALEQRVFEEGKGIQIVSGKAETTL